MEEVVTSLVAQIRRIITDRYFGTALDLATDVMFEIRAAYDHEDWDSAMFALSRVETPETLNSGHAVDSAANEVWQEVKALFEPAISRQSEGIADTATDGRPQSQAQFLSDLRYWEEQCPDDLYPRKLRDLYSWEEIREAGETLITYVVRDFILYAFMANVFKDSLSESHYEALTRPLDDSWERGEEQRLLAAEAEAGSQD